MRSIFVLFFINLIYTNLVKSDCIPLKYCAPAQQYIRFMKDYKDVLRNAHCGFDNDNNPTLSCTSIKFNDCFLFEKCPIAVKVARSNLLNPKKKEIALLRNNICDNKSGKYIKCIEFSKQILKESLANSCEQNAIFGARVVNGKNANIYEFPWMALFEYEHNADIECAGSLISSLFVLTAAHCIINESVNYLNKINFVKLGVHDKEEITNNVAKYRIKNVYIHPEYNKSRLKGDLALINLEEEVKFNDFIKPICLKYLKNYEVKTPLHVAGWGNNNTSSIKQKGIVLIEEYNSNSSESLNYELKDKIFCKSKTGTDTCAGDSGGPIMYESAHKYYLVGVTSFGSTSCGEGGFYTKLGMYFNWILETIISDQMQT